MAGTDLSNIAPPDLTHFLNVFISLVQAALHDMLTFVSGAGPVVIPAIVIVTFIVLICGTILTVMYIVLAALKPRW